MAELLVGLMSGTSQDGIDAALVELDEGTCTLLRAKTTPFPDTLAALLAALIRDAKTGLRELGALHTLFGEFAAQCVLALLEEAAYDARQITAIGFSGHTIFHQPDPPLAFTLQIGNPNSLAAGTGITTVADLRGMDIAFGGQGAPLLPAFHAWRFADPEERRVIVNIGGIANLTCLSPGQQVIGFDSGPGNTLMDAWCSQHGHGPYDASGGWAASGKIISTFLQTLKSDPYFQKRPPKSTGLEHFNPTWLQRALNSDLNATPADVQATLLELTAATIVDAVAASAPDAQRLIVCGGGAHNTLLVERLGTLMSPAIVETSDPHGIAPEWVEAVGFAWLARERLRGAPANLPSVTGARERVQLGGVYLGNRRNA